MTEPGVIIEFIVFVAPMGVVLWLLAAYAVSIMLRGIIDIWRGR